MDSNEFYEGKVSYVKHIVREIKMQEGEKTNIEDIAMVCSNCHSMIHRRKPWLTVNQFKKLIKSNKSPKSTMLFGDLSFMIFVRYHVLIHLKNGFVSSVFRFV